jgi:hypothetical protein
MAFYIGTVSIIITIIIAAIVCPFILYWVTKKFNYKNNHIKKHLFYWIAFIASNFLVAWLKKYFQNPEPPNPTISINIFRSFSSSFIFNTLIIIGILQVVFKQKFGKTIASAFVYILLSGVILFVLCLATFFIVFRIVLSTNA